MILTITFFFLSQLRICLGHVKIYENKSSDRNNDLNITIHVFFFLIKSQFMLLIVKGGSIIKSVDVYINILLLNHMFPKITMMLNLGDIYASKFSINQIQCIFL